MANFKSDYAVALLIEFDKSINIVTGFYPTKQEAIDAFVSKTNKTYSGDIYIIVESFELIK
jgi:hypothetical protein